MMYPWTCVLCERWQTDSLFGLQIFDTELKEQEREVCSVDIAYDEIPERYYKDSEVGGWVCVCVCVCACVCVRVCQ